MLSLSSDAVRANNGGSNHLFYPKAGGMKVGLRLHQVTVEALDDADCNPQIAGMLRALAKSVDGCKVVKDRRDTEFIKKGKFTFEFRSDPLDHPVRFAYYVDKYLSQWVRVSSDNPIVANSCDDGN